jgi:hypothetical protein
MIDTTEVGAREPKQREAQVSKAKESPAKNYKCGSIKIGYSSIDRNNNRILASNSSSWHY